MIGTTVENLSGTQVSGFGFDSTNERGAINSLFIKDASITNAKIASLTFDKAVGGTLTLGGTANGNGYGQVLDSSGGTVITLTNTGINVYGGNINVYDSSGGTVVDSLGLNSSSNFYSDSVTGGTHSAGLGTTPVTGGTLSALVLSRSVRCFIYIYTLGYNLNFGLGGGSGYGVTYVYDTYSGGTINGLFTNFSGVSNGSVCLPQSSFCGRNITLSAGTHTLSLLHTAAGAGTSTITSWELGLIKLGN